MAPRIMSATQHPVSEELEPPNSRPAVDRSLRADRLPASAPLIQTETKTIGPAVRVVSGRRNFEFLSQRSEDFCRRFFPQAGPAEWNDWHWQLGHRITTYEGLSRIVNLSPEEVSAIKDTPSPLPLSITPYFLSLLDPDDPAQALRRTVCPTPGEAVLHLGEADDPLGEDHDSPAPNLVHRYPDRVLLLVTDFCSTYCRYCTRSRVVGHRGTSPAGKDKLEAALAYIEATPRVRDVLISGGDPLTMSDQRLDWLLTRLGQIPHVEFLRIGTKAPVVLPQRITRKLVTMLKRHHPLWVSIHFTHPDELTPEVAQACNRLANAGIPLGSQTVLLKGINDRVETLTALYHGLLKLRVKPYYLYQCDPIRGSAHFRTQVSKGLEMIQGLRGHTTGYAVPTYVIDAPGGGGKVALYPESVVGRQGDDLVIRNYKGLNYFYPDQAARESR